MTNLHAAIPEEKLTEAYRLLLEMRDNCVKHADDQYDDPKREAKYEALNIAITAMGRSIPPRWISVEDEYPDSKLKVLVIVYEDMYDMGEIKPCPAVHTAYTRGEDEGWFDWYSNKHIKPTHWLPMSVLPELPEEE